MPSFPDASTLRDGSEELPPQCDGEMGWFA